MLRISDPSEWSDWNAWEYGAFLVGGAIVVWVILGVF